MSEKLQKLLAHHGLGSRREIERWIEAGEVMVNGKIAELGQRATLDDRIQVRGKAVHFKPQAMQTRVLLYHKPEGEVCTRHDEQGRATVFNQLPKIKPGKWINVGRLDINSLGLLLFTNDGELAHRLMHPSYAIEREYAVRVLGNVTQTHIDTLLKGIRLDDGMAKFDKVTFQGGQGANSWYHVLLHEGRHREVRRLWEALGFKVSRLIRIRYANILLPPQLKAGRWQELETKQVKKLLALVDLTQ